MPTNPTPHPRRIAAKYHGLTRHNRPRVHALSWHVPHATTWRATPLRRLAVDGKTVKGSRRADGRPVHLVAGVSPDSLRLVAQRPVDEKSNEITALRPMLTAVPLDGVVVTADAMQAQQDAGRFLVQEKGSDYFFSLKGNQPSVQAKAERLLDSVFFSGGSGTGPQCGETPRSTGNS